MRGVIELDGRSRQSHLLWKLHAQFVLVRVPDHVQSSRSGVAHGQEVVNCERLLARELYALTIEAAEGRGSDGVVAGVDGVVEDGRGAVSVAGLRKNGIKREGRSAREEKNVRSMAKHRR